MPMKDLIDFNDITENEWSELHSIASDIMKNSGKYIDSCKDKILATLFYEPSTRTMFSFQTAMLPLGGKVIGFSEPLNSSIAKGENLQDTIKTVSCYADLIVMRHFREGAAMAAAMCSDVPVINAGDGGHLHPTQTLTDLTTISFEKGRINNLVVGICGDLKNGRTVHSLIKAMSRFENISFVLISPDSLKTPEYLTKMLKRKNIGFIETADLEIYMGELDILYMTRIQAERFADKSEYERNKGIYVLDCEKLKPARSDMIIMHPLPRVDEIAHEVDQDPRAKYFKQAKYGLYIRMALILRMLTGSFSGVAGKDIQWENYTHCCSNPNCITNSERYLPQHFSQVKWEQGIYYCGYCERQYDGKGNRI